MHHNDIASPASLHQTQQLQEDEYFLPYHWLYKKGSLKVQQAKMALIAAMVRRLGGSGKAMDLGCGDGKHTADLQRLLPDYQFQGIDFSARAIAFARLLAPHIPFEVQQAGQTALASSSFQLIVSIEVIEHIAPDEVPAFLSEIYRLLKPGGHVVLTTPTTNRPVDAKHHQHFTEPMLRQLLQQAGFVVAEVQGYGKALPGLLNNWYRYAIDLPMLWRLQSFVQGSVLPAAKATCILVSASKPD